MSQGPIATCSYGQGRRAKATTRDVIGKAFTSDYIVSAKQSNGGNSIPATVTDDLKAAGVGDVLAVISSDDGSRKDIPLWLTKAKHELLGTEPVEGATRFICRKTH